MQSKSLIVLLETMSMMFELPTSLSTLDILLANMSIEAKSQTAVFVYSTILAQGFSTLKTAASCLFPLLLSFVAALTSNATLPVLTFFLFHPNKCVMKTKPSRS